MTTPPVKIVAVYADAPREEWHAHRLPWGDKAWAVSPPPGIEGQGKVDAFLEDLNAFIEGAGK